MEYQIKIRKVSASDSKWGDIKHSVIGLSYIHRGVEHTLPSGQTNYIFFNSASASINGSNLKVDSKVIGCTLSNNTIITIRFHEDSGEVVIDYKTEA